MSARENTAASRLLFIPVSAPSGMGEYARCLSIAQAVARRRPDAHIHFVLSRMASYAGEVPFPATLLPASPTLHSREVIALIGDFRPDVVVFDNAGRTAQLKAARRQGARTVFITSRSRQRRKAFRLRWMRLLDEHWIAYPKFAAGELTGLETLKLRLLGRPRVRYLDALVSEPTPDQAKAVLDGLDLKPDSYVLVIPGGGTRHWDMGDAPQIMGEAAGRLATRGQCTTVLVGAKASSHSHPLLKQTPRLAPAELTALIRHARVVISNGGATMLQVLACRRPCIATPTAGDQGLRISRCEAAGVVMAAKLETSALEAAALSLLDDDRLREEQLKNMERHGLTNSLEEVIDTLVALTNAGARK